ncbi:MAG: class I SAM-dependent methyltransferase [Terriglobales bacterium]|jgi:ubiquinone/menaquinone biosynthesis C-methylase UbiE
MSHFSTQAKLYAEFRPDYPQELFEFIASSVREQELAWDCATGSGQAALGLAKRFDRVIATDISAEQIANAKLHKGVEYRVAPAERSGLPNSSVDAVTITQALHWLDMPRFYDEVRRVAKPGAVFVATVYSDPVLGDAAADRILHNYNKMIVGPYWPPERKIVDEAYAHIEFPFEELATPELKMEREWSLSELAGYLRSWSATNRYVKQNGIDPVIQFEAEMSRVWGDASEKRPLHWPFTIRAGRVN